MKPKIIIKYFLKSLIFIAGLSVSAVSAYFGFYFFRWIGFNPFFSVISSILVVGMVDAISQVLAYLIKNKKLVQFGFLFPVFGFFLFISVFGTYIGLNEMIDYAKIAREQKAETDIQNNTKIKLIDSQIESAKSSLNSTQIAYDNEIKKESSNWWTIDKMKTALDSAQNYYNQKINERAELENKLSAENKTTELFTDESGNIDSRLKVFLSISLGIILDISGCLIIMFSWIFGIKKDDKSVVILKENIAIDKWDMTKIDKTQPETITDYILLYYDKRVTPGTNQLSGLKYNDGMPNKIAKDITAAGLRLGYIYKNDTRSYLADGINKFEFVKGIEDYLTNKENKKGEGYSLLSNF